MNKVKIFLFLALYLYVSGCSDEGMMLSEQVFFGGDTEGTQGESTVRSVPPEVQVVIRHRIEQQFTSFWPSILDHGPSVEQLQHVFGVDAIVDIEDPLGYLLERSAYYDRYIDADGIAIVGNSAVEDRHFRAARVVTLVMTSKYPRLRKSLLTVSERYPFGFYQILFKSSKGRYHDTWGIHNVPELFDGYLMGNPYLSPETAISGSCIGGSSSRGFAGYCFGSVATNMPDYEGLYTFTHELAHAVDAVIRQLDPTFRDRLYTAYTTAHKLRTWEGSYADENPAEYWAEGAEMWFHFIGPGRLFETREAFFERDPLLAEMLAEVFPAVSFPQGCYGEIPSSAIEEAMQLGFDPEDLTLEEFNFRCTLDR